MSIRLELYKIFNQVAENQSFSKASKKLFMTQPAVSQSIMQLEEVLGIRLFTRTSRGVLLTNEGRILKEYTQSAINLIQKGEKIIESNKNLESGSLKIGVGDTISRYFLLKYLKEFNQLYPNIKLKMINQTTMQLCQLIKSGEIDLAICNLPIDDKSLDIRVCMQIQDIFVVGEKYKNLLEKEFDFKDLNKYPLIFLDQLSKSRQYVEEYLKEENIEIQPDMELGSHDLLIEFAKINLGIACVIKEFSMNPIKEKKIFELNLKKQIPHRSIGLCFLKGVSLSSPSKKFAELILGK